MKRKLLKLKKLQLSTQTIRSKMKRPVKYRAPIANTTKTTRKKRNP
uniref:Uncharacterized protein n=1 Tax=Romanomermis culicivorax TaxID=13658 RepID=A0A915J079_ROMCU